MSRLLLVTTNTCAMLLAVSVQSTAPRPPAPPAASSTSIPSVLDSMREMASPSLLRRPGPPSPAF